MISLAWSHSFDASNRYLSLSSNSAWTYLSMFCSVFLSSSIINTFWLSKCMSCRNDSSCTSISLTWAYKSTDFWMEISDRYRRVDNIYSRAPNYVPWLSSESDEIIQYNEIKKCTYIHFLNDLRLSKNIHSAGPANRWSQCFCRPQQAICWGQQIMFGLD